MRRFLAVLLTALALSGFASSGAWAQASCPINAQSPFTYALPTYALSNNDECAVIVFSYSASPVTITVPIANTLAPGFQVTIIAQGNDVVLTPVSGTINGAGSSTISKGLSATLYGNGSAAYVTTGASGGTLGAMTTTAGNAVLPDAYRNIVLGQYTLSYPAEAYSAGGCVAASLTSAGSWDGASGHDVGPCINAAIAVAAFNGGGTVVIPAGSFFHSTQIHNTTNGVKLMGAGFGSPRDNSSIGHFIAITRLIWNGSVGATQALVEPDGTLNQPLYAADITGIVFDCNATANICLQTTSINHSFIQVGVSEPRSIGLYMTATTNAGSPGSQDNDIWAWSRATATSDSFHPTGILFDGAASSAYNISKNRFHRLFAWFNSGDGIVFGYTDNNIVDDIEAYPEPSPVNIGRPVVLANTNYTMPNGIKVNTNTGFAGGTVVIKHAGAAIETQGFQTGVTISAGGGNVGSATYNPLTLSTSAQTTGLSTTLTFASTTGIVATQSVDCGAGSGVRSEVAFSTTATTVSIGSQPYSNAGVAVPNGQSCVFGVGLTQSAAAGTYTMTAVDGTHWNLAAPSGGHSVSNVAVSSGTLQFGDITFPIAGTPNAGDIFTIQVPTPSLQNETWYSDASNLVPVPHFESGATGISVDILNNRLLFAGPKGITLSSNSNGNFAITSATGAGSFAAGGAGGNCQATNTASACLAAQGGLASGYASFVQGINVSASGLTSIAQGNNVTASGVTGNATGAQSSDRGRYNSQAYASGAFAAQGDAQIGTFVFRGTGASSGGAIRLTADQGAAGSGNCLNIPNNSAFHLSVNVAGVDHTTPSNSTEWSLWSGLLIRGASAATTALTMAATPTPITTGTVTGQAIAATADTTNGCLNLTITHPTNTDAWNYVSKIETVEVQ